MNKPIRSADRNGAASAAPRIPVPPTHVVPNTIKAESEERHRRISEAAYYRSQHRGFEPGHEDDDWLEAERELDSGEKRANDVLPEDNAFPASK
jgi:hypothetical protein